MSAPIAPDVGRVAGGDALVDDVGVEARQVERGRSSAPTGGRPRRRSDAAVAAQVGAEEADQHGAPPVRMPSRNSETISSAGSGSSGDERRVAAGEGEAAQHLRGRGRVVAEVVRGRARTARRARAAPAWPVAPCCAASPRMPAADMSCQMCSTRRWRIVDGGGRAGPRAAAPGRWRPAPPRWGGSKAASTAASISASLSGKTRKIVPSAMPAASAIWRVVTVRPAPAAAARWRRRWPPGARRAASGLLAGVGPGRWGASSAPHAT